MKNNIELTTLATKLDSAEAKAFRELAARRDTTVSRMLSDYIRYELSAEKAAKAPNKVDRKVVLSLKNLDRIKGEVARHNPDHLNPNEMVDSILDRYFDLAKYFRA